jgi:hypothetical protein
MNASKVCMFLNYSHHLNAADDFSSLSVVLGSLGGDVWLIVDVLSPPSSRTSATFALILSSISVRWRWWRDFWFVC